MVGCWCVESVHPSSIILISSVCVFCVEVVWLKTIYKVPRGKVLERVKLSAFLCVRVRVYWLIPTFNMYYNIVNCVYNSIWFAWLVVGFHLSWNETPREPPDLSIECTHTFTRSRTRKKASSHVKMRPNNTHTKKHASNQNTQNFATLSIKARYYHNRNVFIYSHMCVNRFRVVGFVPWFIDSLIH